jgi:arylsulfatase A-like enzyme
MVWPKAVRDGDWKLVMENKVGPQLYSISQDRNEKKNLAAEFPTRVLELQQIHAKTYAQR